MPVEQKSEQYKIINAYEDVVFESVRDLMNKQDMCTCEKCFKDVCAIVFNKGYVCFVTTPQGQLMAKLPTLNNKKRVELMVAITEAIEMVRRSPKH